MLTQQKQRSYVHVSPRKTNENHFCADVFLQFSSIVLPHKEDTRINFRLYTLVFFSSFLLLLFPFFLQRDHASILVQRCIYARFEHLSIDFSSMMVVKLGKRKQRRCLSSPRVETRELFRVLLGFDAWILKFRIKAVKRGIRLRPK